MSACTIREAAEADLAGILALYAEGGLDPGAAGDLSRARAAFARIRSYPDYRVYVAEAQGALVGSCALLVMDNLAHDCAPSAVLEDVVVASGCRRRGIGRALIAHAVAHCRARGCYKLALSSARHRAVAQAFYASLGFEAHGTSWLLRP